ncbi:MAG: SEC-C domain-containing protein [Candidatus Acidiferrales bacterium]
MSSPTRANPAVVPAEGVTKAERYLAKLCRHSFLSMWSYPGVFKDQGRHNGKGDGKEVCDLLVVFENHIIIFSDKDCHFDDAGDLLEKWARWFKRAVIDSAKQIWGAERSIRRFPDRLFIDRKCTIPFPIKLPDPAKAIFHRIVVAHDASRACRERLGGSGSLMLDSSLTSDAHFKMPFAIGQLNPDKGYVHVFDDTTLNIVMSTLDTITDFTAYLAKKEQFLTGKTVVHAAGEEELLAVYLRKLNASGEHDFVIDGNYNVLSFEEGFWEAFIRSPERKAQIEADRISYSWDKLIEKFSFYAMTGTQYFTSGQPLREQEVAFRFLAREPRTRRRLLATSIHEVLERSIHSSTPLDARVNKPVETGSPWYVFLVLKRDAGISDGKYRKVRKTLLANYCQVTKLKFPDAIDIIGIATESGVDTRRSEDLIYVNTSKWSAADEARAKEVQNRLGLLKKVTATSAREYEYPVNHESRPRGPRPSRNSPCPCGTRKRYKNCHGKEVLSTKRARKTRRQK